LSSASTADRRRRLMRLRVTAPPTFRLSAYATPTRSGGTRSATTRARTAPLRPARAPRKAAKQDRRRSGSITLRAVGGFFAAESAGWLDPHELPCDDGSRGDGPGDDCWADRFASPGVLSGQPSAALIEEDARGRRLSTWAAEGLPPIGRGDRRDKSPASGRAPKKS
jgi:hypothetical protein